MVNQKKIKEAVALFLEGIGEDTGREGLAETPERIARMCEELFAGMEEDASGHLSKTFGIGEGYHILFCLRTPFTAFLRQSSYCLYTGWQGSRYQQAGAYGGGLCETASDPGENDRADRGGCHEVSAAQRRYCYGGSRAYVHDNARREKAGK